MASSTTIASSGSSAPITAGSVCRSSAPEAGNATRSSGATSGAVPPSRSASASSAPTESSSGPASTVICVSGIGEPARQPGVGEEPDRRPRPHDHEVVEAAQGLERQLDDVRQQPRPRPPAAALEPRRERVVEYLGAGRRRDPRRGPQARLARRRAAEQQRAAARPQRSSGGFDRFFGNGRARRHRLRRRRAEALVPAGVGGQDQRRDAATARRRDGLGRQRRRRARVGRGPDPVRGRPHDPLDVRSQRRAERLVRDRVIADQVHHRRPALVRVVHVRERVPEPGPEVQQRRGRDLGHPRVAVGGRRCHALEQRQDAADIRHAVHRRHQVHLRRPGIREADLDAARRQRPQDALRAVQSAASNAR